METTRDSPSTSTSHSTSTSNSLTTTVYLGTIPNGYSCPETTEILAMSTTP